MLVWPRVLVQQWGLRAGDPSQRRENNQTSAQEDIWAFNCDLCSVMLEMEWTDGRNNCFGFSFCFCLPARAHEKIKMRNLVKFQCHGLCHKLFWRRSFLNLHISICRYLLFFFSEILFLLVVFFSFLPWLINFPPPPLLLARRQSCHTGSFAAKKSLKKDL